MVGFEQMQRKSARWISAVSLVTALGLGLIGAGGYAMAQSNVAAGAQNDGPPKVDRVDHGEEREKHLIGEAEYFYLPLVDIVMPARIDTGATTTSMHASDIVEFERDGKAWVRFTTTDSDREDTYEIERPVVRTSVIKRREGQESVRRPVVMMELTLGDDSRLVEVNLANREDFTFPLLIGRNYLEGYAIVDVSLDYTQPLPDGVEQPENAPSGDDD